MDDSHINSLKQASLLVRFCAYTKERFPLLKHVILIVSYYSSNQFLAQVLDNPNHQVQYSTASLLGLTTLLCIFFHLRVFDEHKDFEEDLRFYPNRLLQSGVITLSELRMFGAVAFIIEITFAAVCGIPTLITLAIVILYSLLMLKEFFVSRWLKKHFLIYTFSHMLIMPLLAALVFSFTTGKYLWEAPPWFWVYAVIGLFVTLNWEISRKIKAPTDEMKGLDSYSKTFGTYGAAYMVLAVRVIDTALVAAVGYHIGLSIYFYTALILLYIVCLYAFFQFRLNPTSKNARKLEDFAGMYIVAFDIALTIEIVRKFGMEF